MDEAKRYFHKTDRGIVFGLYVEGKFALHICQNCKKEWKNYSELKPDVIETN